VGLFVPVKPRDHIVLHWRHAVGRKAQENDFPFTHQELSGRPANARYTHPEWLIAFMAYVFFLVRPAFRYPFYRNEQSQPDGGAES